MYMRIYILKYMYKGIYICGGGGIGGNHTCGPP